MYPIKDFLSDPDLRILTHRPKELKPYLTHESTPGVYPNLDELFDIITQERLDNVRYLEKAVQVLASLDDHPHFRHRLIRFFVEDAAKNPITAGAFHEIFFRFARTRPEVLSEFPNLLCTVLEHIELLGFQEVLFTLICDFPDHFALPNDANWGLVFIAKTAFQLSSQLPPLSTVPSVMETRLLGILSGLLEVTEDNPDSLPDSFVQLEFVQLLVEATFLHPERKLILHTGAQLIRRIVRHIEQILPVMDDTDAQPCTPRLGNAVSGFIREYSKSFYSNCRQLSEEERLAVFPVLWATVLDEMFERIWEPVPLSAEVGQALVLRVTSMDDGEFWDFIGKHKVIDNMLCRFRCNGILVWNDQVVRGKDGKYLWLNPYVMEIARHISVRMEKTPGMVGVTVEKKKWEKFIQMADVHVLPYFECAEKWQEGSDEWIRDD